MKSEMRHKDQKTKDQNMTTRSRLFHLSYFCLLLTTLPALAATKRAGGDALDLPEPVQRPVKYFGDIHPVLAEHCVSCHGPDKQKGGLRLDSREMALMGGSGYGPAIVPGKSADSPLILFMAHLEPEMEMPPKKDPLPDSTIAVLLLKMPSAVLGLRS